MSPDLPPGHVSGGAGAPGPFPVRAGSCETSQALPEPRVASGTPPHYPVRDQNSTKWDGNPSAKGRMSAGGAEPQPYTCGAREKGAEGCHGATREQYGRSAAGLCTNTARDQAHVSSCDETCSRDGCEIGGQSSSTVSVSAGLPLPYEVGENIHRPCRGHREFRRDQRAGETGSQWNLLKLRHLGEMGQWGSQCLCSPGGHSAVPIQLHFNTTKKNTAQNRGKIELYFYCRN